MPLSRVVILDNFDSFTFNVRHGLVEAGARVEVHRAETLDLPGLIALEPELLVISPGPRRPEDATLSLEALRHFGGRIPILGICLGMQCMAVAFGGRVGRSPEPVHGKVSAIHHDGRGLFEGLPDPLRVGRYHSLCVTEPPPGFEVAARTGDGVVMALRHRTWPMVGVQFHPDSFLTDHGTELLSHVLHERY
nr:aminodeoxychorismate/anthranilate synthase component II [uncultured Holophaga sp.]